MSDAPERPAAADTRAGPARTGRSALLVAIGIFCSRVTGLVRQRVFAHYFGLGPRGRRAFWPPVQDPELPAEPVRRRRAVGVVHPGLRLAGRARRPPRSRSRRRRGRVAARARRQRTRAGRRARHAVADRADRAGIHRRDARADDPLVRILFPGAGLLVLSAWCLGVLNSHHRFLLSYTAPVMWNAAMIATLVSSARTRALPRLAEILAWGSVVGSALQFAVQLPVVLRVAPDLRFALDAASGEVRTVVRNFVPVFISRGVVQLSAYVDSMLASLLPTGAVAGAHQRADAVHAAGQPVRHVGVGGRTAGDVGRGDGEPPDSRRCAGGSTPACGGSRSSSCRRRWRFWRSATSIAAALLQTGQLRARRRGLRVGHSRGLLGRTAGLDARPALLVEPTTRCAIRARRCASRIVRVVLDDGARLPLRDPVCRAGWASRSAGASPG